MLTAGAVVDGN